MVADNDSRQATRKEVQPGQIPQHYNNPVALNDYLSREHVERYRFALSRIERGAKVLDIACGAGYGTAMLLEHGCRATGADYDPDLVAQAKMLWGRDEFVVADARELHFPDECFDVVVTFETIEHVLDGSKFLSEMRRVLVPGGELIISTPNIAYTAHPQFHVKEYEPREFFNLVTSVFDDVQTYGQYFRARDRLHDFVSYYVKNPIRERFIRPALPYYAKLKQFLSRRRQSNSHQSNTSIREAIEQPPDPLNSVREYTEDRWLRIMVATARKNAG